MPSFKCSLSSSLLDQSRTGASTNQREDCVPFGKCMFLVRALIGSPRAKINVCMYVFVFDRGCLGRSQVPGLYGKRTI